MIHEKSSWCKSGGVNNQVGLYIGTRNQVKEVIFGNSFAIFGYLSQRNHVTRVCGDKLSFHDRPTRNKSSSFDRIYFLNNNWKCKILLFILINYLLIVMVELSKLWIVEWVYLEVFLKAVCDTVELIWKIWLYLLDCSSSFFRKQWLWWRNQYFVHQLELKTFFRGKVETERQVCAYWRAYPTKICLWPAFFMISSVADHTVIQRTAQPLFTSDSRASLIIHAPKSFFSGIWSWKMTDITQRVET